MNEHRLREVIRTILSECIKEHQLEEDSLVQKLDLDEMETLADKWADVEPAEVNEFKNGYVNAKDRGE